MTKLKLHYDGWLALPATVRRRLGVTSGDQLTAEWTDGGLLISSPKSGSPAATAATEVEPAPVKAPAEAKKKPAAKKPAPAAKKAATKSAAGSKGKLAASTIPKARGRRKAAGAA